MFTSYFRRIDPQQIVIAGVGLLEGLLLARLIGRLFAARPDHVIFAAIFDLTAPLVAPLRFLDAGQPAYGAVLEFSTLALVLILPVLMLILQRIRRVV